MIYNRQVYKQQLANVGLHGIHERRYFTGVHGSIGQEGDIFGLINLLKLTEDKVLSKELIDDVKKQEEDSYKIEKDTLEREEEKSDAALLFEAKDEDLKVDPTLVELLKSNGVVYTHTSNVFLPVHN